jgi:thiamine biosynthesis lipoprotein
MISRTEKLMGNRFIISIDANEDSHLQAAVDEIRRIETLFTTFSEDSITAEINRNAGIQPVKVPREYFELVQRSLKISELTGGMFDLTYGSLDKSLWNFDIGLKELPLKAIKKNLRLVNYRRIILDAEESSVYLANAGMRIGFGGIGKGYAADRAVALLKSRGVTSGVVNASGDLKTWGTYKGGPWTIAVADPDAPQYPFSQLEVGEMAVATSGPYEKFTLINGKRYSHTIDPRSGLPISGLKSVTVVCPHAELADAMTTPLSVLGVRDGLALINRMENIACILVDERNQVYTSKHLQA